MGRKSRAKVLAYGGMHNAMTYDEVVGMAARMKEKGSTLLIVRVEGGFELVCFDDDARMDSEYVTLAVGRRLYSEGHVDVLVTWYGPEDEPKTEEAFAARREEQVFGDIAPDF